MWDVYADYNRSAVVHIKEMWKAYFSGAYASNVECMHASSHGPFFSVH